MGLSIIPIGGYGEVGRNCTAIEVDDELFILDMGLHLENYVRVSEDEDLNHRLSKKLLIKEAAVPDISIIDKHKVKGILISHAHLDHVGAIPFLANTFGAPIYGTPFTTEVAKRLAEDKRQELRNEFISHKFGKIFNITDKVKAEFVEVTHSTPQTAAVVLHTPYGAVVYMNDFKLDEAPQIGNVTNIERLAQIKPKALILDTLYADVDQHTPSESFAKELLESALLSRDLTGKHILISTFASHISRIQTIVSIAKKMNRKVMIVGRSMAKYLDAAKSAGISDLIDTQEVVRYGSKVRKALKQVKHHQDYIFIVTGGMGEPRAVLSRIVDRELIPFRKGDLVVFSNRIIPTPTIIEARKHLEHRLSPMGYELLKDLHVSGHAAQKDHKRILESVKPEILVPVHSEDEKRDCFKRLAKDAGYSEEKVLLLYNGDHYKLA